MKYETLEEKEPQFEAKGIETVRRDGIPANQKILEQSLKYVSCVTTILLRKFAL